MSVETEADLEGLVAAGRVVRAALDAMAAAVRPAITTAELNEVGAAVLRRLGARSAPMLVYRFPAETCISVNDEIVHGIPGDRALREGDLVKLDVTVEKNGYMADAAVTLPVGRTDESALAMIACARRALASALRAARSGARLNEIGRAVSREARLSGLSVVRDLDGHGIGRTIHEEPRVPNRFDPAARQRLTRGLVLAVEPMITSGSGRVVEARDGWTVLTADGAPAVHVEQTIVVMDGPPLVLTAAA